MKSTAIIIVFLSICFYRTEGNFFKCFLLTPPPPNAYIAQTDYCKDGLCQAGLKHVACNNSGGFAATCPADAKILKLSAADIETILNEHNRLRNTIASGQQTGFSSATKMSTLVWNQELADLAELNVRTCAFAHDQCRNTEKLKYVGQNIAITMTTLAPSELTSFLISSISDWYSEVKDALQSDMNKYETSTRVIGHFTQIVNDRSNELGCAVVQYKDGEWNNQILTCNYARTNIIDFRIYESGLAGSKCTKGSNSNFAALCNVDEPIDANELS